MPKVIQQQFFQKTRATNAVEAPGWKGDIPCTLKVNDTKWRQLCFEWRCLNFEGPEQEAWIFTYWNMWGKHEAFTSTWTRRICPWRCWDIAEKSRLPGLPSSFYHRWSPINLFWHTVSYRLEWPWAALGSCNFRPSDRSQLSNRKSCLISWMRTGYHVHWVSKGASDNHQKDNQTYVIKTCFRVGMNQTSITDTSFYGSCIGNEAGIFCRSTWCFERINSERSPSSSSMKVWSTFDAANVGSWEDGWKNRQSGHVTKELKKNIARHSKPPWRLRIQ